MSTAAHNTQPLVLLLADANSTSLGAERHVADLLTHLPREGFRVALGCPPGGDLGDAARGLRLPVFELPVDRGFTPATLRAVRRAIECTAPDVVHAHGSRSAAYARVCDPLAARRVVYTIHGVHAGRGASVLRTALTCFEWTLRHRTAHFVTVCESDAAAGARLGLLAPERTSTIHNGLRLPPVAPLKGRFREELRIREDTPLVLSVARFHAQKDHVTLLKAWRTVATSRPEGVLALVGAGELESRLRAATGALGLAASVRFVPPREATGEAYVDADVFALSSRSEGLPYVILEAMAHGLPVVGTNVDGIPEAVDDGLTGLLVPPRNPAALAEAILRLLSDPEGSRLRGCAGREKVSREFSLEQMVSRLAVIYRALSKTAGTPVTETATAPARTP